MVSVNAWASDPRRTVTGNLPAPVAALGTFRLNVTKTLPSAFVVLPVNGAVDENENASARPLHH